jgi:hypothetical protein
VYVFVVRTLKICALNKFQVNNTAFHHTYLFIYAAHQLLSASLKTFYKSVSWVSEKYSLNHFNLKKFGYLLCLKWLELHQTEEIKNSSERYSLIGLSISEAGQNKKAGSFQPLL